MSNLEMDNENFQNRPVSLNPRNNLLEIEEHMYILEDVEKPNVFRNMFPYSEVPKIPFNDRIVPHNMPKEIWITDTTFRDGQQSRAPYSTEQIVTIYDYLIVGDGILIAYKGKKEDYVRPENVKSVSCDIEQIKL